MLLLSFYHYWPLALPRLATLVTFYYYWLLALPRLVLLLTFHYYWLLALPLLALLVAFYYYWLLALPLLALLLLCNWATAMDNTARRWPSSRAASYSISHSDTGLLPRNWF